MRETKNMSEENQVQLGNKVVGEIELPSIDIDPYLGRKARVESVKEYEGQYGYYIKVETDVIDTLNNVINKKTGKPVELRASRMFSLNTDRNGNVGWGAETKLGLFLKKMRVSHYNDLVGKEVVINKTTTKEGAEFLSF